MLLYINCHHLAAILTTDHFHGEEFGGEILEGYSLKTQEQKYV
jgi:hypothetical protein